MRYSRHKLDKAGQALIGTDPFLRKEALTIIQEWREDFFHVLQELNSQLLKFFGSHGVVFSISSMRIKRMTSIEAKLRNNVSKGTKLGGLQDIGGIRFVFDTIGQLDKVSKLLDDFVPEDFERIRSHNYVEAPKESGYRSIHYVYKYHDEDPLYDGLSIELQVRTKMQHSWAMAVETASLISQTSLKADIDDGSEWRGFFKLVSALFAKEEGKPVYKDYDDYDDERFCTEYFQYERYRLTDQLRALRVTVSHDFDKVKDGYCVLTIDFVNKIVHALTFPRQEENKAVSLFSQIEHTINKDEAALMVGIEDMREIREAYPSYFLDTKSFLQFLSSFDSHCRILLNMKQ